MLVRLQCFNIALANPEKQPGFSISDTRGCSHYLNDKKEPKNIHHLPLCPHALPPHSVLQRAVPFVNFFTGFPDVYCSGRATSAYGFIDVAVGTASGISDICLC